MREVPAEIEAKETERSKMRRRGVGPDRVLRKAAELAGVEPGGVKGSGKRPGQCMARFLFCKWMVDDLGYSGAEVAGMLEVSKMAVTNGVRRGREVVKARRLSLS